MADLFRRKTFMILALAVSLGLAVVALALDASLRDALGQSYWILGFAMIGCILLVLAGYVWDRTLIKRLREVSEAARSQSVLAAAAEQATDPARTRGDLNPGHDEIIGLARQIERMAQSLQKVEASYRGVVEDQIDLICRYRADGIVTFVNAAMADFFGIKRADFVGHRLPIFERAFPAGQALPETASFELDWADATGRVTALLWTHRAIKGHAGEVLEYQAVGHDITARREAEAALVQAKEAAELADRAKSEFLATVSHELQTPLREILNTTQTLQQSAGEKGPARQLENIQRHAAALDALISDILDLSRLEAGKLELTPAPFVLRDAINEIVTGFHPAIAGQGLNLDLRIDPGVPAMVNGDARRIRQILANLLGNALKFTERGQITVSVTSIRGDDVVGTDRRRLRLFFAVADTGIGIQADKLGDLFRPFAKLNSAVDLQRGGTGLGLAISKRLCEAMGGAMSVESRHGEGSTFRFSLGLEYQKADSNPPLPFSAPPFASRPTTA